MSLVKSTLQPSQNEWLAQFVTGAKSVETDWEEYLTAMENQGLSEYLQLLQDAYDQSPFKTE